MDLATFGYAYAWANRNFQSIHREAPVTRDEFMRRLIQGLAPWEVTLADPLFVGEAELVFDREVVLCRAESLFGLADGRWDNLLENSKAWLNASLLFAEDGRQIVSVLPGPVVGRELEMELSVNVSLERRRLILA